MKPFWHNTIQKKTENARRIENRRRMIELLYKKFEEIYGAERFLVKAKQLNALNMINSDNIYQKLTALERIVSGKEDIEISRGSIDERIEAIKERLLDILAEYNLENELKEEIAIRMEQRQQEYIREIKREILSAKKSPDTPETLRKLARLEKMQARSLTKTELDIVKPGKLNELIGQDNAVRSLVSKIASPYPQHIIIYGPPGVGKTTAARLAFEEARKRADTPFCQDSKFVEVDGTTLRWDPRESTNPLLGSVHDPIYQGAKRSLAEEGIPEPKTGLVTEAHGGILFIDEIGELDPVLQNKLLKVMEDKRVTFESSYYDENNENIPLYIKKLFKEGAPADFILIGATTRSPEAINPAFRSRCAEVFFNPLSRKDIQKIVLNAVRKLNVEIDKELPAIISNYTIEGRTAINLILDAYSFALYEKETSVGTRLFIEKKYLYEALQNRRMTPYNKVDVSERAMVGRVLGLGVKGFLGSIIEIEALAFPAVQKGKGQIFLNETAGSMTRDSLFNAGAVVRRLTGKNLNDYDLHVNIVGGGNVDGPSAGIAILLAVISAIEEIPLKQDIAITGEVSIHGRVKPVGGVREKVHAAEQAGIRKVLIPAANENDLNSELKEKAVFISTVDEALKMVLVTERKMSMYIKKREKTG